MCHQRDTQVSRLYTVSLTCSLDPTFLVFLDLSGFFDMIAHFQSAKLSATVGWYFQNSGTVARIEEASLWCFSSARADEQGT